MATFNDGEQRSSIRTKINASITKTDAMDQGVATTDDVEFASVNGRDVAADGSKLDGIETGADVTDTANVTAAGALMDSELTSEASVKGLDQGVATTDSPEFAGLTVDTDTLYVDSANNRVGIGTSSPPWNLSLYSNAAENVGFTVQNSVTGNTNSDGLLIYVDSSGNSNFRNRENLDTAFWTNDTEAMRIDSSGRVGIGTSSPNASLTLGETSDAAATLATFRADGVTNFFKLGSNGSKRFTIQGGSSTSSFSIERGATEDFVIDSSGRVGIGTSSPSATLDVNGSLSKNSGSFKIDHPIKPDTHHLVHSFVEGPQADNLYRGKVTLADGTATVNLDEAGRMTEGTFAALNGNVQCFTTNEYGWTAVRGKVNGNILTIEAQDPACADEVSWLVIGERHDQHMIEANWTDEQGRVITEPQK